MKRRDYCCFGPAIKASRFIIKLHGQVTRTNSTRTHLRQIWSIHKTPDQSNFIKVPAAMPETRRHVLEELLTKARTLNDDSGYDPALKEETLWDTLVFGLRSDKGRKEKKTKIRCPTPELEPTIHLRCNAKFHLQTRTSSSQMQWLFEVWKQTRYYS